MSSEVLYAAIRERLTASWTATPVCYENETFAPPQEAGGPGSWMQVEITAQQTNQISIGAGSRDANAWREVGMLWLHVFVPSNSGSAVARALARQAVDLFRGTELGSTTFLGASIGLGDRSEVNGSWWRLSAAVDFEREL